MSRKLITVRGENYIGEYPKDPEIGWVNGMRGTRRTLCKKTELTGLSDSEKIQRLNDLYHLKQRELRNTQSKQEEQTKKAKRERKKLTVKQALKLWAADIEVTNAPKTVRQYKNSVNYYVDACGNHALNEFSISNTTTFLKHLKSLKNMQNLPFSAETQAQHIRKFNTFLNWCYDHEIIDRLHRLKRPKVPQKDMETYDIKELEKLGAHIQKKLSEATEPTKILGYKNVFRAYVLATSTVLRIGAIWALPIENIDLKKKIVRIRDNHELDWKNKGMKWPDKPINRDLLKFLKDDLKNRAPEERFFLDNGKGQPWRADRSDISKWMSKLCAEIGLANIKPFHWGMRATIITELLTKGVDPYAVQMLADHESITTTMKYFNKRKVQQKKAADSILNSFSVTKVSSPATKSISH